MRNIHTLFDSLPGDYDQKRAGLQALFDEMPPDELAKLKYEWTFWARPNQLQPNWAWTFWLLLAGRGFGKTRSGAEWVRDRVESGQARYIHLIAPTAADVRKTMVEGESGLQAVCPPWNKPVFEPSKLMMTWPNGAKAFLFSAEEPERLRGPQCDTMWMDELAAWKRLHDTWDMAMFGFRLGDDPRCAITTTPKPLQLIKELLARERTAANPTGDIAVTRGSTYDNRANLSKQFYTQIVSKYEGTRQGRQELHAEILEDMPGALWKRADIDRDRVHCLAPPMMPFLETDEDTGLIKLTMDWETLQNQADTILKAPDADLSRVVVSVDPNASNDEGSDEIGITVTAKDIKGHGYTLADVSIRGTPNEWASTAVLLHDLFKADRIIGEANQGGNMVEQSIINAAKFLRMQELRDSDFVSIVLVHATRGKVTRAEPVSMLYEQGRISHVGTLKVLEDQLCLFTSDFDRKMMGYSPDRVDALVWGFTHLFLEADDMGVYEFYRQQAEETEREKSDAIPDPSTFIRLKAPPGLGQAFGIDGDMYPVDDKGFVAVPQKELRGLRQAGYVEC